MENNLEKIINLIDFYRKRIIFFFILFVLMSFFIFLFSDNLLEFLCSPFLQISATKKLIFVTPLEVLWVKTKISIIFSCLILLPIIFLEIIKQINFSKKYLLTTIAIFLFYAGICFSYYIFMPILLKFFLDYKTQYITILWTISNYTDLVINFSLITGMIFELPLIFNALLWLNIFKLEKILEARKYIIVGIFIFSAVITPGTDVIPELLIGIPLWLIFEINILILRLIGGRK